MKTTAHKMWFVFNGVLESFSLCFNVDSLSLSRSFPSLSNYRCSFAIQNLNQSAAYSFIYGHPCILAIQTHADTQIFTGLYGSAACICLLPLESKHHLLMNKLSDPLSFIHSVLALYMHAPDRQRFIWDRKEYYSSDTQNKLNQFVPSNVFPRHSMNQYYQIDFGSLGKQINK